MKITFSDRFIAYLALLSGLSISAVAVYYSVIGLTAIFAAAFIPIVIMGVVLELGKLVATIWLKQNWNIAPKLIRGYLLIAVTILMIITSMGIFGYLSKAHMDQAVPTGDIAERVAVIDEKIRTQRENIDAAKRALKQMDESVDQIMARSSDERGAEKAAALRRAQQKERATLQNDISRSQSNITALNEERAPIAKDLRKVEAEVGPIKYIAALIYGDDPNQNLLERAVRWVIIFIVIIFDPLAVVLLLASQYSFQWFRKQEEQIEEDHPPYYVADVGEKPTKEELSNTIDPEIETQLTALWKAVQEPCPNCGTAMTYKSQTGLICPTCTTEGDSPEKESDVVSTATVTESIFDKHPYLKKGFQYPPGWMFHPPIVGKVEKIESADIKDIEVIEPLPVANETVEQITPPVKQSAEFDDLGIDWNNLPPDTEYMIVKGERMNVKAARDLYGPKHLVTDYVQNEEQNQSGTWNKVISAQEYRNKAEENATKNNPSNTP